MQTSRATAAHQESSFSNFGRYLRTELARRCAANPQYSLRAFALHLGIDHSTLSQLFRGKRPVTVRMIKRLGQSLGLGEDEIEVFITHEKLIVPGSKVVSREIHQLTLDSIALLSDPVHRSILELMKVAGFIPDVRTIARIINASVDEVNIAITRLLRLGLLEMAECKVWVDRSGASDGDDNHFAHRVIEQLSKRVSELRNEAASETGGHPKFPAYKIELYSPDLPLVVDLVERLQKALANSRAQGHSDKQACLMEINIFPANSRTKE